MYISCACVLIELSHRGRLCMYLLWIRGCLSQTSCQLNDKGKQVFESTTKQLSLAPFFIAREQTSGLFRRTIACFCGVLDRTPRFNMISTAPRAKIPLWLSLSNFQSVNELGIWHAGNRFRPVHSISRQPSSNLVKK